MPWSGFPCGLCVRLFDSKDSKDRLIMDPAKLAKLQAQAAANRIGEYFALWFYLGRNRVVVDPLIVKLSCQMRSRWKGNRAQKNSPES
jgi:hypothetical protein